MREVLRHPYAGTAAPYDPLIRKAYARLMGIDLVMVVLMVGFFLLAAAFVVWLDKI